MSRVHMRCPTDAGVSEWRLRRFADDAVRRGVGVSPHPFIRRGWRFWICDRCYAPKSLHPRTDYVVARPLGDSAYLSADAPHFKEGW